jgi:hypothetical protein
LGALFGLSQSRVNRWIHRLLPLLQQALDALGVLPSRRPRAFARQERGYPETPALSIEGTDRRRQRPNNQAKQAVPYSGKLKPQSDKNVVVVKTKSKRVGYLSQASAGTMHDKSSWIAISCSSTPVNS